MGNETKTHVKETADRAAKTVGQPEVIAVFRADCRATRGHGSTVAVVRGGTGKCRLYGRNSLANAFPENADVLLTLNTADKMADQLKVPLVVGKAACDSFVKEHSVKWSGNEAVVADAGKSGKKRGGFRAIDYSTF